MKRVGVVLLGGACVACASHVSEGFDNVLEPVGEAVVKGLAESLAAVFEELRAHPGSWRALLGLSCGSETLCQGEAPSEGDRCSADALIWSEDFSVAFDACVVGGAPKDPCFREALAAHTPSPEQTDSAQQCRARLSRCGVESDACDALEALVDPALVERVQACVDEACDDVTNCMVSALMMGVPKLPDRCELHVVLEHDSVD